MSDPYIGEIRMFAGNFPPLGWAFCNGQYLPISENDALFILIGTIYGGDGQETFRLPDLQSRFPIHEGTNAGRTFQLGEMAGVESVTLTTQQIPIHNHAALAGGSGDSNTPANKVFANWPGAQYNTDGTALQAMDSQALAPSGGSQPHENMPPYLAVHFIISLFGYFPQQN